MEKRIILRGFGVGAFGGLPAFVFARIMSEPLIQKAIDYESGRDAAQNALRKAAGLAVGPEGPEVFSRGVQRTAGIGTGMILYGIAMGGFFAVAYILTQRKTRSELRPRVLALLVAGAGFLSLYLVPFLKYPANPPAVGHGNTIGQRTLLYTIMVVASVAFLIGAVILARRLTARFGGWNATLLAGGAYIVVIAIVMLILPPLGHLHTNVVRFGTQVTETPLPLRGPNGQVAYPGFPADVLFKFRLYSLISQAILWSTIGLAFGPLLERMFAPAGRPATGSDAGRVATAPSRLNRVRSRSPGKPRPRSLGVAARHARRADRLGARRAARAEAAARDVFEHGSSPVARRTPRGRASVSALTDVTRPQRSQTRRSRSPTPASTERPGP